MCVTCDLSPLQFPHPACPTENAGHRENDTMNPVWKRKKEKQQDKNTLTYNTYLHTQMHAHTHSLTELNQTFFKQSKALTCDADQSPSPTWSQPTLCVCSGGLTVQPEDLTSHAGWSHLSKPK